jgi:3-oxoacyl-[acyl-carrier-protein] synthase-1
MATLAIRECLADVPREEWSRLPLLLCVAEAERPGRLEGLDDELFAEIEQSLGAQFAENSSVVAQGRVAAFVALLRARAIIGTRSAQRVLIVATDSLVTWPTLSVHERNRRLLTPDNSNGFIPGEGAGAVLVGAGQGGLQCVGIGSATEAAHIDSEEPLRGEGLTQAIRHALGEAGCAMHDVDFRITDISGEQYYFKEAALALGRLLRVRKQEFDLWHPAECVGETGAVAGATAIAVAEAACRKRYARGSTILLHAANDSGHRVATVWRFRAN